MYERVLFVDPGLSGTGLAHFQKIRHSPRGKTLEPNITLSITPPRKGDWKVKCLAVMEEFASALTAIDPYYVVLEFQEIWGDAVSQAAAKKGDLQKLTYLTGAMGWEVHNRCPYFPISVKPTTWKGQLPKKAVDARIKKYLGKSYKNHISDAVGMGLWAQGKIK